MCHRKCLGQDLDALAVRANVESCDGRLREEMSNREITEPLRLSVAKDANPARRRAPLVRLDRVETDAALPKKNTFSVALSPLNAERRVRRRESDRRR